MHHVDHEPWALLNLHPSVPNFRKGARKVAVKTQQDRFVRSMLPSCSDGATMAMLVFLDAVSTN